MIHVDTSVLIDALTGPRRSAPALRRLVDRGERLSCCTLVLYEWSRGPRQFDERQVLETLIPTERVAVFGPREALVAADIYGRVRRPRGRELDLAIAACALTKDAAFWTLNLTDFRDIPGLRLVET